MRARLKYILSLLLLIASSLLHAETYTYQDILNKSQTEQREALQETFSALCSSEDNKNQLIFHALQGGLSRASLFSFMLKDQMYVLRFLDPRHAQTERENEIQACKIAYSLGIAPACFFSDRNALLIIIPYIHGHSLSSRDLENPQIISSLGKMIRSLHTFTEAYPNRYTLKERLNIHYQKGIQNKVAFPSGFDASVQLMLGESSSSSVPTHGDLNPSNILVDDKGPHIIDWTTATWDDPFSDLSYLCMLSNMDSEQEREFLTAYFDRTPTNEELEQLQRDKLKVYLTTAAIWFRFSETAEDKKIPYEERVARLDAQLNSPNLKGAEYYLNKGEVIDIHSGSKEAIKNYALSFYKTYLENALIPSRSM